MTDPLVFGFVIPMDMLFVLFESVWDIIGPEPASIIPAWIDENVPETVTRYRDTLLSVFGGVGLVLATWRSIVAQKQTRVAQKQVELAEKAADIDRYQKGAQMLGDGRISVRQAGVVILSELAKTNPQRFSIMCQEVLERFIIDRGQEAERENQKPEQESGKPKDQTSKLKPIFADTQSALEAAVGISTGEHGRALRLKYAYLVEANLKGANLTDAELRRANLTGADLGGANLTGASLWSANLTGASLWSANLTGARLVRANLTGASLKDANLTGANFAVAIFTRARRLTWERLDKAKTLEDAVGLPPRPEDRSSEKDEDEDQ